MIVLRLEGGAWSMAEFTPPVFLSPPGIPFVCFISLVVTIAGQSFYRYGRRGEQQCPLGVGHLAGTGSMAPNEGGGTFERVELTAKCFRPHCCREMVLISECWMGRAVPSSSFWLAACHGRIRDSYRLTINITLGFKCFTFSCRHRTVFVSCVGPLLQLSWNFDTSAESSEKTSTPRR